MIYVIDTHVLLWFLANIPRLSSAADAVLQDKAGELILPATAYAKACWIVEHGRVQALSVKNVQDALSADARFTIYPLDRPVIDKSNERIAINEMHDRQIVATARVLADTGGQVALLTHGANITASSLVPVIW